MTMQIPEPIQFWLGVPNTTSILISRVCISVIGRLGATCFCCCNMSWNIVDAGLHHGGIYNNSIVVGGKGGSGDVQTFHE